MGATLKCARFQAFSFLFFLVSCDDSLCLELCFQVRSKGWLVERLELGLILGPWPQGEIQRPSALR